jgi:RHS repeat-associated protein
LTYDYDANLNVKSRTDSVAGVLEQFHYDSLDRLHDWQEVGSYGWGVTYSHDDIGNLTGRSLLGGNGETETLTFDHSGVNAGPHAVTSSAWGAYGYDGKGNQTSSPEGTIAYTYFNLPKSIVGTDTSTFKYDASGARVSKSAGTTGTTIYAGGAYERRTVAGSKTHVFYLNASGRQIGQILRKESDQSETVLYIHSDSLGSSEVVTDANGQVVGERRKYDPFGAPTDITLPKAFPGGSLMSTDVHIGFTGHEEDSETGLINMRGRIYNPRVGHFLTPDPFISNPFSPVAFNPYAYVLNNPLNHTDPSGFEMCTTVNGVGCSIDPGSTVNVDNTGWGALPAKPNPFGDDEGGGGGGSFNVYDPSNWSPNSPFTPGVESLGDNKGTMIMRLPGGGWMRSDDPAANADAGGTVYVLGKDGSRMGMPLDTYIDNYEYTGDGISGQHNQQVRDNRGEIDDNPSLQSIANNVSTQPTPMRVGGQSAATTAPHLPRYMDPSTPGMGPNAQREAVQVKSLADLIAKLPPSTILLPNMPPGVSLADNLTDAKQHRNEPFWFANKVRPGGDWDYAHNQGQVGQYRDLGNFNYGFIGTALGYSPQMLHFMAGALQIAMGHSEFPWGMPGEPFSPGGDSPVDYFWIEQGIALGNAAGAMP